MTFVSYIGVLQEDFDQAHNRGCGLLTRNYQKAAVQAHSLAKDFSPIIELVKEFAWPHGGVAVGTISVLFVVLASPVYRL